VHETPRQVWPEDLLQTALLDGDSSRTISRWAAISRSLASPVARASVSMNVKDDWSFPPASTSDAVFTRLRPVNPATAWITVAPATFSTFR